jgi:hypothetical protein
MNRSPSSGYSPHENAICSLKKRSWPLLLHRPGFSAKQCASCSAFTPGNVVIHRIGDGVAGLNDKSVAMFLDEYSSVGMLVKSSSLHTTVNGANKRLVTSVASTSEGLRTRVCGQGYLMRESFELTHE